MNTQEKIANLEKEIAELKKEINNEVEWTKFTFRGKEYEISEDLGEMSWSAGGLKCKELGGQLPPRWLLVAIADEPELAGIKEIFGTGNHWSATEYSETNARYVYFTDGFTNNNYKANAYSVRCVRGL